MGNKGESDHFLEILENLDQSRFLGRGCDEALFSEKRGFQ